MKVRDAQIKIVSMCGDELLDVVLATVNYELSGDGGVFLHTNDLNQSNDTNDHFAELTNALNGYEGLILLRR